MNEQQAKKDNLGKKKKVNEFHFGKEKPRAKQNETNSRQANHVKRKKRKKPNNRQVSEKTTNQEERNTSNKQTPKKKQNTNRPKNKRQTSSSKKFTTSMKRAEDLREDNERLEKEIILDIQSIRQIEIE